MSYKKIYSTFCYIRIHRSHKENKIATFSPPNYSFQYTTAIIITNVSVFSEKEIDSYPFC